MRQYSYSSLFIVICILMAAAVFLNVACDDEGKPKPPEEKDPVTPKLEPPTPEQLAERAKLAEQVKKAFEAKYRIEKTAQGYSLGGKHFNDETLNFRLILKDWKFIINQKEKRTIEITAPGVGTAKFRFDNSGNLTAVGK